MKTILYCEKHDLFDSIVDLQRTLIEQNVNHPDVNITRTTLLTNKMFINSCVGISMFDFKVIIDSTQNDVLMQVEFADGDVYEGKIVVK